MEQKITVPSSNAGQRLDKFVLTHFSQYSRAYLKEQIKQGNIFVNGKIAKPSYKLKEKDEITTALSTKNSLKILPNPAIKLNIIYEDANVIVINKPAGLSVHPRQDKNGLPLIQEINNTLVSGLLAYYPAITNVGDANYNPSLSPLRLRREEIPPLKLRGGEGALCPNKKLTQNIRPGLVHRLDKDTSGVMIIAKNQPSFEWLKKQFKDRQATKKYLALAHGLFKEKQGEIKTLLARAKKNPTKQKISKQKGKEAVTQYKVIQEFKNYTLLEASPKTGRLHQIRVHLAHIGHPVAGNTKYGGKSLPILPGLTRQFLHAQELKITLPDGQKKTFSAPLPIDLKTALNALEKI